MIATSIKHSRLTVVVLSLALLTGCGGGGSGGQKVMPQPKRPPKVPATQRVAQDLGLQESAKREIKHALAANDPVLKAHAIEAIRLVMPAEGQSDILAAMADPDPLVRFAAVMAVGDLKIDDTRPELQQMADDQQAAIRVASLYALHQLGDYRRSKELEKYSQDLVPSVRATTAVVLGLIGDPSALKVLRPMQRDQNATVRLQVAEAMWRLGDEAGRDELIGAAVSRYPDDQMVATIALGEPRDVRVRPHVRANLTADYAEVTLVAARVMGWLGSDEGFGVALIGFKSPDPRQRALAALAFGAIGRLDAQEYLAKLLKDDNPEVRIAAATAILQLKAN